MFTWIVIIRALLSWVRPDPHNPIVRFMDYVTEPFLSPIRRLVPPEKMGGLDLSPLILIFIIQVIEHFIY
ncbi:MAG: YggT family protein [Nitrospirota bacterium]|nr:YggT family protein [Nitrospirota bacterium]